MRKLLIPLAVYVVFVGIFAGYSYREKNNYMFLPVWDIRHYQDISERGYEARPCTENDYPPGKICGNVGWYPFWPLVTALARPLLGGSSRAAFIGLTFLFTLLSFVLLHRFVAEHYGQREALVALLALAFGPGSFYFLTGFPYALFIFLLLLYLYFLYKPPGQIRTIVLFFSGLAMALTYPSGILFAFIPLLWNLLGKENRRFQWRSWSHWLRVGWYLLPFVLGPVLLWSYFYFKFDDFFLQLHFQEKYHRTWAMPLFIIFESLTRYPWYTPENITMIWYGLVLLAFIPYKVRTEIWVMALLLYLFSPATGTTMSIYRHYLVNLPVCLIMGVSQRPFWLKIILIALGLVATLHILFPLFISNRLI